MPCLALPPSVPPPLSHGTKAVSRHPARKRSGAVCTRTDGVAAQGVGRCALKLPAGTTGRSPAGGTLPVRHTRPGVPRYPSVSKATARRRRRRRALPQARPARPSDARLGSAGALPAGAPPPALCECVCALGYAGSVNRAGPRRTPHGAPAGAGAGRGLGGGWEEGAAEPRAPAPLCSSSQARKSPSSLFTSAFCPRPSGSSGPSEPSSGPAGRALGSPSVAVQPLPPSPRPVRRHPRGGS